MLGLGTPGSLTVVSGVGQSRESHGSLWVGHSRDSHGSPLGLGTPGTLMVVSGVGHSRDSHGSLWGWALQGLSR